VGGVDPSGTAAGGRAGTGRAGVGTAGFSGAAGEAGEAEAGPGSGLLGSAFGAAGARATEDVRSLSVRLVALGADSGCGARPAEADPGEGVDSAGAAAATAGFSAGLTDVEGSGGGRGRAGPDTTGGADRAGMAVESADLSTEGVTAGRSNQIEAPALTSTAAAPIHGQSRCRRAVDIACTV
jgi:hypothetical protein